MDNRRSQTKDNILGLTVSLIGQQGYEYISARKITQSLGISSSAFYKHFKSKEELLDEVLVCVSQIVYDGFRKKHRSDLLAKSSIEQLYLFGIYLHEQFLTNENLMHFLFFSPSAIKVYGSFDVREENSSNCSLLNEAIRIIREVKCDNGLYADVETLCTKWWAFLQGYTLLVMSHVIKLNSRMIAGAIDDVIFGDRSHRPASE